MSSYLTSVLLATTLAGQADAFMFSTAQKKTSVAPRQTSNEERSRPLNSLSRDLMDVFDMPLMTMSPLSSFLLDEWRSPSNGVFKTQIPSPRLSQALTFNLDIAELDNEYKISCDLPGISKEDINIIVLPNRILEISTERKQEEHLENAKVNRQERYYGYVKRTLSLPQDTDEDGIKASYVNGVLDLSIPKREEAKPISKKIEIADHIPSQELPNYESSTSANVDVTQTEAKK